MLPEPKRFPKKELRDRVFRGVGVGLAMIVTVISLTYSLSEQPLFEQGPRAKVPNRRYVLRSSPHGRKEKEERENRE